MGQLAFRNEPFSKNSISAEQMGGLIDLVQRGKLTGSSCPTRGRSPITDDSIGTAGKTLLRHMLDKPSDHSASDLARELSLLAGADDAVAMEKWCAEAIAALPQEAEVVRRGNVNVLNKILGSVMKLSKGRADARAARTTLLKMLTGK